MLVPFPFSDLSRTKLRPAVVLADAGRGDWILVQITSKAYADDSAVPLREVDFASGTLSIDSFARPGKLFTAHQSLLAAEAGRLRVDAIAKVVGAVVRLIRPKQVESPPTPEELRRTVADCFYAAAQCATFYQWQRYGRPSLSQDEFLVRHQIDTFLSNGITEATLMFFRKTHEFFRKPGSEDKPDTLHAYRWAGYQQLGPVFPQEAVTELHKRVGHITLREARYGKVEWEMYKMTIVAFGRWIDFFKFLSETFYKADAEMMKYCESAATALEGVRRRVEAQQVALEKAGDPA